MASRFVGFVGSLPPDEQRIWLPNQLAHDPQSWFAPHLFQLKSEYGVFLNMHDCKEQETYIVQAGGCSTGYATVAKCTVQSDDEEVGTLGQKHGKDYE